MLNEREKQAVSILEKLLDKEYVSRWTIFPYRKELIELTSKECRYASLKLKVEEEIEFAKESL